MRHNDKNAFYYSFNTVSVQSLCPRWVGEWRWRRAAAITEDARKLYESIKLFGICELSVLNPSPRAEMSIVAPSTARHVLLCPAAVAHHWMAVVGSGRFTYHQLY